MAYIRTDRSGLVGHVVKISQTILTSADAGGPIKLNEPAYRVTAALERPNIDAYGKKVALQPDMLLKADIILERRSLMSWLTLQATPGQSADLQRLQLEIIPTEAGLASV
jgi:multidrug efflux pump subunit AcrA (membrane-fusion protein)